MDDLPEGHPIEDLVIAIHKLGWHVAIPNTEEDDPVRGMIIGESDYIKSILDNMEED